MRISGHCGKDRSGKKADSPEGPIRRRYQGEREKAMYETEERLRKKGKQAGLFRLSAVAAALVMVLPCLPSSAANTGTLWNSDNVPQVPSETVRFTGSQLSGDYMGVIARDSASGSLQNLVLDIQAVTQGEIIGTLKTYKKFSVSKEETLKNIITDFSLSEEDARNYMEKYW